MEEDMDSCDVEVPNGTHSDLLQFHSSKLWGLDFCFKVFNKMYIRDILNMEPYPSSSGVWAYKNHPIYKVDILGIVVKVAQNSKCFLFTVDDGTGSIICCCWKDSFGPSAKSGHHLEGLPGILQKKADELLRVNKDPESGYQLGDLINVRGQIRTFREEKEIVASYHSVIHDPMQEVVRMCELPELYRRGYDRPYLLPDKVQPSSQSLGAGDTGQDGPTMDLKEAILRHLTQVKVVEVVPSDLLKVKQVKLLLSEGKSKDQLGSCTNDIGRTLQALVQLEEEGKVVARSDRRMLFEVLLHDSKMEKSILKILSEETKKPKFAENGCHHLHIVQELHKTIHYAKVKVSGVLYCLQKLEVQSDLFRTTKFHYLPCSV